MSRSGLLINYEHCSGCQSCAVACKQEHGYPEGKWGIKIEEKVFMDPRIRDSIRIDYVPFPTKYCDLCRGRTRNGEQPACIKHCQAWCMYYGTLQELTRLMEDMPRAVLYSR